MIRAVIGESLSAGEVRMEPATLAVMNELRDFMFERVYQSAEQRAQQRQAITLIRELVDWHLEHPYEIPETYREHDAPPVVQVADYVAGMTDRFAVALHERLFGRGAAAAAFTERLAAPPHAPGT